MSEIWNFSPSLNEPLQICITAARPGVPDEENRWLKVFGPVQFGSNTNVNSESKTIVDINNTPDLVENDIKCDTERPCEGMQEHKNELSDALDTKNAEEMTEALETEFLSNFDVLIKECLKNHTLLTILAQRLSSHTKEKLCSQVFDRKDVDSTFLRMFFHYFLPNYIKCEYNSSVLDIVIRGNKIYPIEFRILLKTLVKDLEIPTKVLQDYVLTLNDENRAEFVTDLAEFDLTGEEFVNILFSIYTAYKDCVKSDRTQSYVQTMLLQYSSFCVTDRNYGRLLLAYLQAQKVMKSVINYELLEKLIEQHRSPFKRPCLILLKEIKGSNNENRMSGEDDSD